MNRFSRWIGAVALAVCASGALAASGEGLMVRLSTAAPVLRGDVDVMVNVTVTNTTRSAINVLRWELPAQRHQSPLFRISRDGQAVAYLGALVKRAEPTATDYVRIEPGSTLSYDVELTSGYDLAQSGTYTIEYTSMGATAAGMVALQSAAPAYLWLESRSGRGAVPTAQTRKDPALAGSITYTGGCTASQQTALATSVTDAANYATAAVSYFASSKYATARYVKWFGPGNRSSWAISKKNYTAIQDAFVNQALVLDCSCTDAGVYAYVFPNQPYKIYACPVFWTAPALGTDSKAGTMIHEMSHFTVVAGTQDFVYGQSGAAALAISNPANALRNADNHEYFAENTPVLP
jgi:peptidyl-Lys metalloendopeptidase